MRAFEFTQGKPSVDIAKNRLKLLLISDRVNCSPDMIEKMKFDLYYAVAKYIEITPEKFDVQMTQSDIHIKITGEK
ncbi:MAG: cell division topological specificity factor MinE [Lachnospiraceae bacterium]